MNVLVKSDSAFTSKCRKLQDYYRVKVLDAEAGRGPTISSEHTYGNYVVNGKEKNLNFLNEYSFRFAKQKVNEKQINPDLTIDEYRLFNNLLSSMPMAFNLFGLLRKILEDNPKEASNIGHFVFSGIGWLHQILYIDIEFIPRPIEFYTNDKSAFDVFIKGCDNNGKPGIITIETKYTDLLGSNSSKNNEKKIELLTSLDLVDDSQIQFFQKSGFGQLERNFLLTLAYKRNHNFRYFDHIILSPQEDKKSIKEINSFTAKLKKYSEQIHKYDLEKFIIDAQKSDSKEYKELAAKFYDRYLNYSLVA